MRKRLIIAGMICVLLVAAQGLGLAAEPREFLWARSLPAGPSTNDRTSVIAIALTPQLEPIVLGYRYWRGGFENQIITNYGIFLRKYNQAGSLLWERNETNGAAHLLAIDGEGNIYLGGTAYDALQFGSVVITNSDCVFIVKCDPSGIAQSVRTIPHSGGGDVFELGGMALDSATNLLLCGSSRGRLDFSNTNINTVNHGVWLAKLAPDGTALWARDAVGGNDFYKAASDISVTAGGEFFVTGTYAADVTFGTTNLSGVGPSDVFVARYDADGLLKWVRRIGGPGQDSAEAVAIDSFTNVYVAGSFPGTCTFNSTNLSTASGWAIFLAKYDGSGTLQWASKTDRPAENTFVFAASLALASNDIIYLGATFRTSANFGVTNLVNNGVQSGFVAQYDADGTLTRALQTRNASVSLPSSRLVADHWGRAFVMGDAAPEAVFGSLRLTNNGNGAYLSRIGIRPALQLTRSNSTALLKWDPAGDGFFIDRAVSIAPQNWSTIGSTTTNASRSLVFPTGNAAEFFRLRNF